MVLSDISIRRPVLATVISLIIVLIGVVSYQRLPVREYPKIDEPVVTVETKYRCASAEVIESRVTKPIEEHAFVRLVGSLLTHGRDDDAGAGLP